MPNTYKISVTATTPVPYGDVYAPIKGYETGYIDLNFIESGKMTEVMDPALPELGIDPDNIDAYVASNFTFSRIFANEQDLLEYVKDPVVQVAHKKIVNDLRSRGFEVVESAE